MMKKSIDHKHKIRNAGFEDAHAIYTLIKEYPKELLPRAIGDIVQNIDRFVVCTIDGRVVGTAAWQILPEIGRVTEPSIEIKSVAVSRDYQHQGIGIAVVKHVVHRIKMFHPIQIVVLTFCPAFFKKLGFKEIAKEKLMHKLYMGCINCTKYDSPFTCPEVAMILSVGLRNKG